MSFFDFVIGKPLATSEERAEHKVPELVLLSSPFRFILMPSKVWRGFMRPTPYLSS